MLVTQRSIASVHPCPGTPRLNKSVVNAVARILQEFIFCQTIVAVGVGGVGPHQPPGRGAGATGT